MLITVERSGGVAGVRMTIQIDTGLVKDGDVIEEMATALLDQQQPPRQARRIPDQLHYRITVGNSQPIALSECELTDDWTTFIDMTINAYFNMLVI